MIKQLIKKVDKTNQLLKIKIWWDNMDHKMSIVKKPKYYVIRRGSPTVGLFSYFITTLGGIAYAKEHGLIPVVDMKNYLSPYLYPEEVGKVNAWEYYFEQPATACLDEALESRACILGRKNPTYVYPKDSRVLYENQDQSLTYWRKITSEYIKLKPNVIERVNQEKKIFEGKKVLAVSCRGTDYVAMKPKGHSIQPDIAVIISKCEEVMQKNSFNLIYLATEDSRIVKAFQQSFGELVCTSNRKYAVYDDASKYITGYSTGRKNDKYVQGMDYLVSMLLILECSGFITTMASGPTGIMCMDNSFEYFYVFDLGYYE